MPGRLHRGESSGATAARSTSPLSAGTSEPSLGAKVSASARAVTGMVAVTEATRTVNGPATADLAVASACWAASSLTDGAASTIGAVTRPEDTR